MTIIKYLHVAYFTVLSAFQKIQRRLRGPLLNIELEGRWQEVVVA